MDYGNLYKMWTERQAPSPTTARMVRTAMKYLATAMGSPDWKGLTAVSEQHAVMLLDGAMSKTQINAQSRSKYRNYLRKLYRFAVEEKIELGSDGSTKLWAPAPNHGCVPRRAQVTYDRFVKWAIGRGVWPDTVKPQSLLDWALDEKQDYNLHWRKDYDRLHVAWDGLVTEDKLPKIQKLPLPPKLNVRYALVFEQWPAHLRDEWRRMCQKAEAPLRKGGMRPWREITKACYQKNLELFLGWYVKDPSYADLADQTWGSLLTADRCQDFLNWQVARSGKGYINPGHTALLRMVRGFHRFLLDSMPEVIQSFTDMCKRCEVEERDKANRMAPFSAVEQGFHKVLALANDSKEPGRCHAVDGKRLANLQVNAIIFGLLTTRALRRANIVGIRIEENLVRTPEGFDLRYKPNEMKGHRKFETQLPKELIPVVEDYLARGYKALTGRQPSAGDALLVNRAGTPLTAGTFAMRVRSLTLKYVGKQLHPHIFRHIIATHAAQVWSMTAPELAALLGHRSVQTVMKYYEVTNAERAAERFDAFRHHVPKEG